MPEQYRGKVPKQVVKMKMLFGAKREDVEFSGELADADDLEAQARAREADRRQLHEMIKEEQPE